MFMVKSTGIEKGADNEGNKKRESTRRRRYLFDLSRVKEDEGKIQ